MYMIEVNYATDNVQFVKFMVDTSTDAVCTIRKFEDSLKESLQVSDEKLAFIRNSIIDIMDGIVDTSVMTVNSRFYSYRISKM